MLNYSVDTSSNLTTFSCVCITYLFCLADFNSVQTLIVPSPVFFLSSLNEYTGFFKWHSRFQIWLSSKVWSRLSCFGTTFYHCFCVILFFQFFLTCIWDDWICKWLFLHKSWLTSLYSFIICLTKLFFCFFRFANVSHFLPNL